LWLIIFLFFRNSKNIINKQTLSTRYTQRANKEGTNSTVTRKQRKQLNKSKIQGRTYNTPAKAKNSAKPNQQTRTGQEN
jgi:hypothetical protein